MEKHAIDVKVYHVPQALAKPSELTSMEKQLFVDKKMRFAKHCCESLCLRQWNQQK